MDIRSDYQLLIMQATTEANRQDYDDKMKKLTEYPTKIIASMMYQIKISRYSPDNKDSTKYQYPNTMITANNKSPPF